MKTKHIYTRLYRVLRKAGAKKENIRLNSDIFDELGFDSFDLTIYLFYLESSFNIEFSQQDLQKIDKIFKTVNLLEEKLMFNRTLFN